MTQLSAGLTAAQVDADLLKTKELFEKTSVDSIASGAATNYNYSQMGKAFPSSEGANDVFAAWTHATVDYDSSEDKFVVFYNTNAGHDINTNSVMMRKKKTGVDAFDTVKVVASDQGNFSYKCQAAGIAANGDYVALVARLPWGSGASDATYVYRSTDSGATFTSSLMQDGGTTIAAFNGDVSGFLVTSTGRICTFAVENSTYLTRIFYSDDNGATWSQSTIAGSVTDVTEPAWCDVGGGQLVCIARASVRAGTVDTVIPAKFMTSSDNGSTWTEPVNSTSITDFTLSNGEMLPDYDSGHIEFIHHSRHTEVDGYSSMLISRTSFEDALADNFKPQTRIGKLAAYTTLGDSTGDSGYVGAAKAANGVINAFFYTGKRTSAQISYMVGIPNGIYNNSDRVIDFKTGEYKDLAGLLEFDAGGYYWQDGFGALAPAGLSAALVNGTGTGTLDTTTAAIQLTVNQTDDSVVQTYSRVTIFPDAIPSGVTEISAGVTFPDGSVSAADFDGGIAIFDNPTPAATNDGRVGFNYLSDTGGVSSVTISSTTRPLYVAVVGNSRNNTSTRMVVNDVIAS